MCENYFNELTSYENIKQYVPKSGQISKDIALYNTIEKGVLRMVVITIDSVKNGYIIQVNNQRWIAVDYAEVKDLILQVLEDKEYDDG